MYKPGGANAGPRISVDGGCDVLWILRCSGRAVADGVGLLLTVGRNTLVSGKLVMVAGGTLGSSAAPTLGAMVLGGRVGLMMARESRIVVLRAAALLADVGMVFCSVRSTLHAARTVRAAVEIVGIVQWLG
jgi:hypothetical protein